MIKASDVARSGAHIRQNKSSYRPRDFSRAAGVGTFSGSSGAGEPAAGSCVRVIPLWTRGGAMRGNGGKESAGRGLMFVCYQTSITSQFEFLQISLGRCCGLIYNKKHPVKFKPTAAMEVNVANRKRALMVLDNRRCFTAGRETSWRSYAKERNRLGYGCHFVGCLTARIEEKTPCEDGKDQRLMQPFRVARKYSVPGRKMRCPRQSLGERRARERGHADKYRTIWRSRMLKYHAPSYTPVMFGP